MEIGWHYPGNLESVSNLPALDPFSDIDPVNNLGNIEPNLEAVVDMNGEDLEMLGAKQDRPVYDIHSNTSDVFDDDFVDKTHKM